MESINEKLTPKMSSIIKGIAIVFMVMTHAFGYSDFRGDYLNQPIFGHTVDFYFSASMKICVAMFAFITGYAYFFNKKKTYKYSFGKIIDFLKYYWFQLFVIFLPLSIIIGHYSLNIDFLYNLLALKNDIVVFAWYVYFYIFTMLVLPLYSRIKSKIFVFDVIFPIAVCYLSTLLINHILPTHFLLTDLSDCFLYFQIVIVGFACAKYRIFDLIYKVLKIKTPLLGIALIILVPAARNFAPSLFGFTFDIFYAPLIIYGIVILFDRIQTSAFFKIFDFLGIHSMNIWFFHSIFFARYTSSFFKPIAYLFSIFPPFVIIWIIILCLPVSFVANFIFKRRKKEV